MAAVRLLLMVLMCLVTDAPGPVTTGVLEHLEDGEETQASRRRAHAARRPHDTVPPRLGTVVVARVVPPPPPALSPRRPVHEHERKTPAPLREPSTAAEDH